MNESKPTILIVDDTPENIAILSMLLSTSYRVKVATNGEKALAVAAQEMPDLILLDVMMPVLDGYEACRRLKADPALAEIPVIFLTGKTETDDEKRGFELGAVDYITKPISPPIVLARIKTHLSLKQARDFLKDKNAYLEAEIARRIRQISVIQDVTIVAMASLAETRDNETVNHLRRTQAYVEALIKALRDKPGYKEVLTDDNIHLIVKSVPLHDIGKIGIPDNILLKPADLSQEEFDLMKTHTTLGRDSITRAESLIEEPESFLRFAKDIACYHHERWDGQGYPERLQTEAIPAAARLMALADVYDALVNRRVYKKAFPHTMARDAILAGLGRQFEPAVVEAFIVAEKTFLEIVAAYPDD